MEKYKCEYCNKVEVVFQKSVPVEETDKVLTMEIHYRCLNCDKKTKYKSYVQKYIKRRSALG